MKREYVLMRAVVCARSVARTCQQRVDEVVAHARLTTADPDGVDDQAPEQANVPSCEMHVVDSDVA